MHSAWPRNIAVYRFSGCSSRVMIVSLRWSVSHVAIGKDWLHGRRLATSGNVACWPCFRGRRWSEDASVQAALTPDVSHLDSLLPDSLGMLPSCDTAGGAAPTSSPGTLCETICGGLEVVTGAIEGLTGRSRTTLDKVS